MRQVTVVTVARLAFLAFLALSFAVHGAAHAANPDPYNARIWNPRNTGDWFEWWYYKVVVPGSPGSAHSNDSFCFTYGVVNPGDFNERRPGTRSQVTFASFADHDIFSSRKTLREFTASTESTFVQVGENIATDRLLRGQLRNERGEEVSWNLTVEPDWKFNAMGWAMSQPWLFNIYWYPAQASAWMSGEINVKGRRIVLDHAPAYQDRNWGTSFPKWWTWLVSNHFDHSPGTVLAVGGGHPKLWGGFSKEGVTIGLRHQGREHTFRPVDGDTIKIDIHFGKWEVSARNARGERITISAFAPKDAFLDLKFMTPKGQIFHDYETLRGKIHVTLYEGNTLTADLVTQEGGIEYGSPNPAALKELFAKSRTRLQ